MIGQRIRQVRMAIGLTREQVARSLVEAGQPATEEELTKYEEGERFPKADVLVALVRVLGVKPALVMELDTLERLPRVAVPAGYRTRPCGRATLWSGVG